MEHQPAFGAAVQQFRARLGMNQKALARFAGLTPSHLSRIETGTRPPPQAGVLLAMVEALRLTRQEAEQLVQAAGYSPLILDSGDELGYAAPTLYMPEPPHERPAATEASVGDFTFGSPTPVSGTGRDEVAELEALSSDLRAILDRVERLLAQKRQQQ